MQSLRPALPTSAAPPPPRVVPTRLRCAACRRSFVLPPAGLAMDSGGHAIRAVRLVAGATCRRCTQRALERSARAQPAPPLAHAAPRSMRLLVGHALLRDPDGLERAGLLPPGGARPACVGLFRALGAVLGGEGARRALDDVLRRCLGAEARAFDRLCVAAVADRLAGDAAPASAVSLARGRDPRTLC